MRIDKHAVKAILKDDAGFVLVVHRSGTHPYVPFTYDIPGGTLEEGESVIEALRREVLEEVGIDISTRPTKLFGKNEIRKFGKKIRAELYEVCGFDNRPAVHLSYEHASFEWVPVSKLQHVGYFENLIKLYVQANTKRKDS